jgi:hypothetical protein
MNTVQNIGFEPPPFIKKPVFPAGFFIERLEIGGVNRKLQ